MKIILTKNVPKIGNQGDIKNVADGYALNYLFPRKLAQPANSRAVHNIQEQKNKTQREQEKQSQKNQSIAKAINNKKIIIKAKTSDKGHLFAAVGSSQIAQAIKQQLKTDIVSDHLKIDKPIKELGQYTLSYQPAAGTAATFLVSVESGG